MFDWQEVSLLEANDEQIVSYASKVFEELLNDYY